MKLAFNSTLAFKVKATHVHCDEFNTMHNIAHAGVQVDANNEAESVIAIWCLTQYNARR